VTFIKGTIAKASPMRVRIVAILIVSSMAVALYPVRAEVAGDYARRALWSVFDSRPESVGARTIGVSGAVGAVGSVVAGGEIVVNYDSGQVSAFGFGGTQGGWNGGLSGSLYGGHIYGLDSDNSNYSGGFSGFNAGVGPAGGGPGLGVFAAASSGGLTGSAKDVGSLRLPVVVGASVGTSIAGRASFGGTVTNYSPPLQVGKVWPLLLSPSDAHLFATRQLLCK
jgi:hypothetical protein